MAPIKRTKSIIYIVLLILVLSLVFAWLSDRDQMKVIATWKQPEDINYSSFDPYYLSVVTADLDWGHIPFTVSRNYFIYVGRDSGTPSYGHIIDISFHPDANDLYDIESFVKRSEVKWTTEAVIFKPQSGHELKIPKKMFIGGR